MTMPTIQTKNAIRADIKYNRYFHETSISGQSTPMVKGCMDIIMFDIIDTVFSY